MPAPRPTLWQRWRRVGRWFRMSVLWLLLALLAGFIYLNQVGFPGFLKAPLQAELRARGFDLEYERLRLRWFLGIVAESVNLGSSRTDHGPQFYVDEIQIRLQNAALWRGRIELESLFLRRGKLVLPITGTNIPRDLFVVDGIMTTLKLPGDGRWELDQFQANCLGARLHLTGVFTNAASIRRPGAQAGAPSNLLGIVNTPLWRSILRQANRIAGSLQFSNIPTLNLVVQGDVRDPGSFNARLNLQAKGATTPWGTLGNLLLSARLNQPRAGPEESQSELRLLIGDVRTRWGQVGRLVLNTSITQSFTNPVPRQVDWDIAVDRLRFPWLDAPGARITARTVRHEEPAIRLQTTGLFRAEGSQTRQAGLGEVEVDFATIHSLHSLFPLETTFRGNLGNLVSKPVSAGPLEVSGRLRPSTNAVPDARWGWWAGLAPFSLELETRAGSVTAAGFQARDVTVSSTWEPPLLSVRSLEGNLLEGGLSLTGALDVVTRRLQVETKLDLDPHALAPVLSTNARRWLEQVVWERPPRFDLAAQLVLPAWTNRNPNWRAEVLSSLRSEGYFEGTNIFVRGVSIPLIRSHLEFSEGRWGLPDLHLERPEGQLEASFHNHLPTGEFRLVLHESTLDPQALRPALGPALARAFDLFQLTDPPHLSADVRGRLSALDSIGFRAQVAVTNLVVHGQPLDEVRADLFFTNQFLIGTNVVVRRNGGEARGEGVGFDIRGNMLHFTNTVGHIDPMVILRIVGPKTARAVEPYRFLNPPEVVLNGQIQTLGNTHDDAIFEIKGGPFAWWLFRVPEIQGRLHWLGSSLTVSNLQASFYGGRLEGGLTAQLPRGESSTIGFTARAYGADLHAMMADLSTPTNQLFGRLDANLIVDFLNPDDMGSWQGRGDASLQDGFLWDWPLFGIFSPVLNSFRLGWGSSRATAGTATYTITNSVIHTRDMSIRTSTMRLNYEGTVDFGGRLDARVEAEILRDAWLVGRIVGLAMTPLAKIFVYQVAGTLSKPETKPLYVPKLFLFPLQPIQTLKGIFNPDKNRVKPSPRREKSR